MLHRLICSVNIELNDRDSSARKKQQSSCLLPRPDGLWSYPTFYPVGTQGSCPSVYSSQGLKPITHTHQVPKFKNAWSHPPIHMRLYFLLLKHNVQFVFLIEPIFREVSPSNWAPPPTTSPPSSIFPCIPNHRQSHSVHNNAGSDNHIQWKATGTLGWLTEATGAWKEIQYVERRTPPAM